MDIGAMPAPNYKGFLGAFMNKEQYQAARTYIPSPYILADDDNPVKPLTNLPKTAGGSEIDEFGPTSHPLHGTRKAAHEALVKKVKSLLKDKELEESIKKMFGDRKADIAEVLERVSGKVDNETDPIEVARNVFERNERHTGSQNPGAKKNKLAEKRADAFFSKTKDGLDHFARTVVKEHMDKAIHDIPERAEKHTMRVDFRKAGRERAQLELAQDRMRGIAGKIMETKREWDLKHIYRETPKKNLNTQFMELPKSKEVVVERRKENREWEKILAERKEKREKLEAYRKAKEQTEAKKKSPIGAKTRSRR